MTATPSEYQVPTDLWAMDESLQFNEALDKDDPRYVPTDSARGDYSVRRLFKTLGVNDRDQDHPQLRNEHIRLYSVFCGHRGCGKSTELRRIAARLAHPDAYFVIFLDALKELDYNNLNYADVLLALIKELFEILDAEGIQVDRVLLRPLEDWFSQRVETDEKTEQFAAEIKAGATAEGGVPFFAKLFAGLTTVVKTTSSKKSDLRRIVENSFTEFAESFNRCVMAAEDALRRAGKGKKILFIVDGTDRLRDEDRERFFVGDVHQLKQIQSSFIYCAPISLIYESNQVQQEYHHFLLPMIKLNEKGSLDRLPAGYEAMKEMIDRRAHPDLFASPDLVNELIACSGGSPRELFKLLHYAFLRADGDLLDQNAIDAAIHDLGADYKRILDTEDYPLLREIDDINGLNINTSRIRFFLNHNVILEYDGFWRQTHPVIRQSAQYIEIDENYSLNKEKNDAHNLDRSDQTVFSGSFSPPVTFLNIEHLTLFHHSELTISPSVNVLIGENATGKTHLLKIIYSVLSTMVATAMKSDDKPTKESALTDKLIGVFRPDYLGRLVSHGKQTCLIQLGLGETGTVNIVIPSTRENILNIEAVPDSYPDISPVFFPSRELLGIFPNFISIYDSRFLEFEETWRDICVQLGAPPLKELSDETRKLLLRLESSMGGKLELDRSGRFYLNTPDSERIEVPLVAEGIRKFGMLSRLLVTGVLTSKGYLFWDEPESGMNPRLLAYLAEIILGLSRQGIQIFIATHSLFFLRELEILLERSEFKDIYPRFFGLHQSDNGVIIKQGDSIDDVGDIAALDEQLAQSDRFMKLGD